MLRVLLLEKASRGKDLMTQLGSVSRAFLGILYRGYKIVLSPLFGNACRFHPSCSKYAHDALVRYGWIRGGWLAIKRLMRCHPRSSGGIDPIP